MRFGDDGSATSARTRTRTPTEATDAAAGDRFVGRSIVYTERQRPENLYRRKSIRQSVGRSCRQTTVKEMKEISDVLERGRVVCRRNTFDVRRRLPALRAPGTLALNVAPCHLYPALAPARHSSDGPACASRQHIRFAFQAPCAICPAARLLLQLHPSMLLLLLH